MTCHWFACLFYFIARVEDYQAGYGIGVNMNGMLAVKNNQTSITPASWVIRHLERFDGQYDGTM